MTTRRVLSLALICALSLSAIGTMTSSAQASARIEPRVSSSQAPISLFAAPLHRDASAGQLQGVWVGTIPRAHVRLKVDYGNGQIVRRRGMTGPRGTHLFTWTVGYMGSQVVLAHYWVYVRRGHRQTSTRGTFVLYPAPPLGLSVIVFTPNLQAGSPLHVRVLSRPDIALTLTVYAQNGTALLTQSSRNVSGTWDVVAPLTTTAPITEAQHLRVVVTGQDYARHAVVTSPLTLHPVPTAPASGSGSPVPVASPSLAGAISRARAAANGSLSLAQSNAQTAVQGIVVDLQVLGQWTANSGIAHDGAYYQGLLAHAGSYDDFIAVTAQAMVDDGIVQARMRAVMPAKAIMVSIGEQALRAYQNGQLVMFTYVTTGRPELPTVTGHFAIYEKVSPFQFISPWPQGSPYYYAPTWIKYWMPFYSGYGLHDAWWRAHYGPGTNVTGDGPGSAEPTGSHGCVNIPLDKTQWLWNWAPVGTPVVVYGGPSVTPGTSGL